MLNKEVKVSARECVASADIEDLWLQAILGCVGRLEANARRPMHASVQIKDKQAFEGIVSFEDLDHLAFCRLNASPHVFSSIRIGALRPSRLIACFQISGRSTVQQGRRSVRLLPGQWLFIDCGHPFHVTHQTVVTQLILSSHAPAWTNLTPFVGVGFHAAQGLKKLVFDFVCSVATTLPMSSSAQVEVAGSVDRLIHLATIDGSTDNSPQGRATVTLNALMTFIRANLNDAQLSVDTIAHSMGCSRRTVHRIFRAAGGESVERFLWRQRIDACAAEMARSDIAHISLTELAYRYGFSSSASFSRSFRQVHGVSPSHWRNACHAAAIGD